jgi:hypothetical protein
MNHRDNGKAGGDIRAMDRLGLEVAGRAGGRSRSWFKVMAARENGKKGGRPRKNGDGNPSKPGAIA